MNGFVRDKTNTDSHQMVGQCPFGDDRIGGAVGSPPGLSDWYPGGSVSSFCIRKGRMLVAMVDRLFSTRTASLRQSSVQEIKAIAVVAMEIERASAKVLAKGVGDEDEDYELPIYAERLPVRTVIRDPEPCPRLMDNVERPETPSGYRAGQLLEEALVVAYTVTYPQ